MKCIHYFGGKLHENWSLKILRCTEDVNFKIGCEEVIYDDVNWILVYQVLGLMASYFRQNWSCRYIGSEEEDIYIWKKFLYSKQVYWRNM